MEKIFILKNIIQNYVWGTEDFIPNLLGIENSDNQPCAELWMGAHSKAPSFIPTLNKALDEVIASNPEFYLGSKSAKDFNNKLPFLFKVLSSSKPLSIQSHPNLNQAQKGFLLENKAGISLTAFERNYKDDNHKPELLCALTEFQAMCGFREASEIIKNFHDVAIDKELTSFSAFEENPSEEKLKELFSEILSLSAESKEVILTTVLKNISSVNCDLTRYWVVEMSNLYPGDIGALSPLFLNTFILQPGEAVFLKAGILHAYLKGTGMEIMANSDNVLRGGLTPKNIDVPELLSILDSEMRKPVVQKAEKMESIREYAIPINEFSLTKILVNGSETLQNSRPSILITIDGTLDIEAEDFQHSLKKGETLFLSGSLDSYTLKGEGLVFVASTNN